MRRRVAFLLPRHAHPRRVERCLAPDEPPAASALRRRANVPSPAPPQQTIAVAIDDHVAATTQRLGLAARAAARCARPHQTTRSSMRRVMVGALVRPRRTRGVDGGVAMSGFTRAGWAPPNMSWADIGIDHKSQLDPRHASHSGPVTSFAFGRSVRGTQCVASTIRRSILRL